MALTSDAAAQLTGPDTIDCIAPAQGWEAHWAAAATAKRAGAPWLPGAGAAAPIRSTEAGA